MDKAKSEYDKTGFDTTRIQGWLMAVKHLDIEKGTYTGPGLVYLWFRVPLQLFFIPWVYFSTIAN